MFLSESEWYWYKPAPKIFVRWYYNQLSF